jgi:hypothetical protein
MKNTVIQHITMTKSIQEKVEEMMDFQIMIEAMISDAIQEITGSAIGDDVAVETSGESPEYDKKNYPLYSKVHNIIKAVQRIINIQIANQKNTTGNSDDEIYHDYSGDDFVSDNDVDDDELVKLDIYQHDEQEHVINRSIFGIEDTDTDTDNDDDNDDDNVNTIGQITFSHQNKRFALDMGNNPFMMEEFAENHDYDNDQIFSDSEFGEMIDNIGRMIGVNKMSENLTTSNTDNISENFDIHTNCCTDVCGDVPEKDYSIYQLSDPDIIIKSPNHDVDETSGDEETINMDLISELEMNLLNVHNAPSLEIVSSQTSTNVIDGIPINESCEPEFI